MRSSWCAPFITWRRSPIRGSRPASAGRSARPRSASRSARLLPATSLATSASTRSLVTNGVDFDRFARIDPSRLAAWSRTLRADAGPVVLAIGGVEERKNTRRTLRAFARVRETVPGARLWILGGATVLDHGAYRADFDRELALLPAEVRAAVTEIGVVADEDVPAIFRLASVLAFPSCTKVSAWPRWRRWPRAFRSSRRAARR